MSEYLKSLIKMTENEYAASAEDGIDGADITGYYDTGSLILNAAISGSLYGGIPNNKITAFCGSESVGKTWFLLNVIKSFLDDKPEGVCLYFESENAITKDMLVARGIDVSRFLILPVGTVEEFRNQVIKVINDRLEKPESERKPMIMALDSLGMLSSEHEVETTDAGKNTRDMSKAQMVKSVFRVLTMKLGRAGVPLLVTCHTYDKIGSMFPEKEISGGNGVKYAASTIIMLSKRKEKVDNEVVGNIIHCKLYKSRLTKENIVVDTLLEYADGLDRYRGLLPIAEKYGIFKKVSTRYELPCGTKVFEKAINENPEKYYTDEVMEQLEVAVAKEFKYGNEIEANESVDSE